MKAVGFYGLGDIRIQNIEKPKINSGDILMKIKAATTCGTDLKTYLRGRPGDEYPFLPWGHECAGVVAEVGDGVEKFKKGDRIVAHNSVPCFHCYYCKKEQYELCENLIVNRGAYAEYIKIPAPIVKINTYKIPDNLSYAEAALIEPISCTVHGAAKAQIKPNDNVVITGAGFQGLIYVQLAKIYGAGKIISIDLIDSKLSLAREFGATHTINAKRESSREQVLKLTEGRGADVTIEAAGKIKTWENSIKMVRNGGRAVMYAGAKPDTTISVSTEQLHYGAIKIEGVFHTIPLYVQETWNLMKSNALNLSPLITNKLSLDEVEKAYEILSSPDNEEIKIEIVP